MSVPANIDQRQHLSADSVTCQHCATQPTCCAPSYRWQLHTGPCVGCGRETTVSAACGNPHCDNCNGPPNDPDWSETPEQADARVYSHTGWKIFPLWPVEGGQCTCPKGVECGSPGKHPLYPPAHGKNDPLRGRCHGACGRLGHGLYDATDDPEVNAARWARHPTAGIGLPAHGNRFVVIDIDPRKGGDRSFRRLNSDCIDLGVDLTETVAQCTGEYDGERGTHYLYQAPPEGVKGRADAFGDGLPGIDLRGLGHYTVIAPTLHVSGVRYEWINFLANVAPWPAVLTELMNPPKPPPVPAPRTPTGTARGYGNVALERETAVLRSTPSLRNNQLNASAFNLGQLVATGHLDEQTVRRALYDTAVANGYVAKDGERDAMATIDSGLSSGMATPRRQVPNA